MLDPLKKQLHIILTEPVIFLRSSDPSGRHQPDPNDPPALVRGILNLNVVKPIGISSIEVELIGLLTLRPPEAIRSRRIELPETQRIYSSTATVFRADQVPHGRRFASVGPGLSTANSNDDDEHAATTLSRPPPSPRRRSERRSSVSVPPDLGPTPPYTPRGQSPTPIQSRLGARVDNTTQTLEELRQALRDNSEGQACRNGFAPPSSRPTSIVFPPPNSTTHSDASSTSNASFHQENDNRTDDMAHTTPSFEGHTSLHNIAEEPPRALPRRGLSPSRPSRAHSPENTTQPCRDSSNTSTGRSRLHRSLGSVLDAVKEVASRAPSRSRGVIGSEERERGRTRVRIVAEGQSGTSILEVGEGVAGTRSGSQLGANASHPSSHMEHREHHLLGLGRVFGLERDHEKENDGEHKSKNSGEGWREFKPGEFDYPISFLLPSNLPPTFAVPYGSLTYAIKAVAHRPGTFTSKLSCQVPLLVVAAQAIGAGEDGGDPGPLIVQKEWNGKLAYSIELSSRLFLLGSQRHLETAVSEGSHVNTEPLAEAEVEARAEAAYGTAILDLTLLPLEKIKIWRLGVVVDQRIGYVDGRGTLFGDDKRQVRLLDVQDTCSTEEMDLVDKEEQTHKNKHKDKHGFTQIPLLPTPISPHRSPLLRYIPPSIDPSILAGPGPYTLSFTIGLPGCNDPSSGDYGLHFTVKQKDSGVRVEHSLRVVMRIEWVGDEGTNDHEKGDKKKLVDIALQTPITILSCRCVPEYQRLPRYSRITEDNLRDRAACACQQSVLGRTDQGHEHLGHVMTSSSTSSFESQDTGGHSHRHADVQRSGPERLSTSSSTHTSDHPSPLAAPTHPHTPPSVRSGRSSVPPHTHSHDQHHHSRPLSYTVSTSHVRGHSQTPISTPHPSRPPSPLAQYERLVSGLESEAGEAPPSYESIASDL
ncbi:hypothetical protein J3R83DRAFT_10991 [Lanmaoa asiatica]|nr:hypothetical protein J3R83DRAFT_10991 [Lanmaoa asiatica]